MPNYNLEQVLPLGVLTGSQAFNCAGPESDWDIVILEKDLPDCKNAGKYKCTDFQNDTLEDGITGGKPGFNTSEFPALNQDFIEYDQVTIWGPLTQIIKYWDDNDICINLFVYEDHYGIILDKFVQLNNLMNFIHNIKLKDKNYRIQAFTEIIAKVGITDA